MRPLRPRVPVRSPALPARPAFTLVELLVAMTIILVLVGIALLVANSGILTDQRITSGSDRISGWLSVAKQQALRDKTPVGVRFIPDPGTGYILEAQWIEVPPDYYLPGHRLMIEQYGTGPSAPTGPYTSRLFVVGPNAALVRQNVAVGDTLGLNEFGTLHRISGVGAVFTMTLNGVNHNAVELRVAGQDPPYAAGRSLVPDLGPLAKPLPDPTPAANRYPNPPPQPMTVNYSTTSFAFIRQARPKLGEAPLQVPEGVGIDIANSRIPLVQGNYDVLFSPTGGLMNAGGFGQVVLWVRLRDALAGDPREPTGIPATPFQDRRSTYETAGRMSLVTVYTSNGAVAVHPVNVPTDDNPATPHDPYSYTRDGIASGL